MNEVCLILSLGVPNGDGNYRAPDATKEVVRVIPVIIGIQDLNSNRQLANIVRQCIIALKADAEKKPETPVPIES